MPLIEQIVWVAVAFILTPMLLRVALGGQSGKMAPFRLGPSPTGRRIRVFQVLILIIVSGFISFSLYNTPDILPFIQPDYSETPINLDPASASRARAERIAHAGQIKSQQQLVTTIGISALCLAYGVESWISLFYPEKSVKCDDIRY